MLETHSVSIAKFGELQYYLKNQASPMAVLPTENDKKTLLQKYGLHDDKRCSLKFNFSQPSIITKAIKAATTSIYKENNILLDIDYTILYHIDFTQQHS